MKYVISNVANNGKGINLLGSALGVLLFSVSLFSQGNFGRILGTVTDQTGGVKSALQFHISRTLLYIPAIPVVQLAAHGTED